MEWDWLHFRLVSGESPPFATALSGISLVSDESLSLVSALPLPKLNGPNPSSF